MGDAKGMRSTEEMNKEIERIYMIPCIRDKCLKYPACQNKKHIECPDIGTYYTVLRGNLTRDDAWQHIKNHLKRMATFRTGENGTESYIYLEEVPYLQREGTKVFGQEPI